MRYLVFTGLLLIAWSVMISTRELGHLIGGWCGGASLTDLDLVPWRLPYSLHNPDPNPQLTLWGGPIFGVMIPIVAAMAVRRRGVWLIADFCLLANGTYLAIGWLAGDRFLDSP